MKALDLYWATNPDWYDYTDDENAKPFLTDKATQEAKESFQRYLKQKEAS